MSHSDLCSTDNNQEDQMEYYCIPRKFIFDVPETTSKGENTEKRILKKSIEAEKHMPFIFSFPDPTNYKESYSQLVKQVISVYNHIRLLIVEEYYEDLKHVIKEIKVEQPGDCLNMLKELFSGCCEKMERRSKDGNETDGTDSAKDYEELLQKAEAKIRTLIRNEQIFRLNFDILSQKCEDADKAIQASTDELEKSKKAQESLKKENQELVSKLFQKDDEVKKANKERETVEKRLKEAAANLSAIDHLDQTIGGDPKNMTHSLNKQLLGMLTKENRHVPSENSSRPPSNFDGKSWGGMRQATNRMTPTDRGNVSYSSNSSGNLNKVQVDRLKNSLVSEFKKHMNFNINPGTNNRSVLNASLDVVLNKSTEQSQSQERTSVNGTILSAKKRSSQHLKGSQAQDSSRVKPLSKERKLGEYSEKDLSPYLPDKGTMQRILSGSNNKYSSVSTRPVSTGKSRESPLMSRRRVVQTEQSPDNKSQESKALHTYASNQSTEMISASYSSNPKKRSVDSRENKSQSKGIAKSSVLVKTMIADQLKKKLGPKAI